MNQVSGTDRFWTNEREDHLTVLWTGNVLSTKEIAAILGTTGNAVIGKANRLELPKKENGIKTTSSSKAKVSKLHPRPLQCCYTGCRKWFYTIKEMDRRFCSQACANRSIAEQLASIRQLRPKTDREQFLEPSVGSLQCNCGHYAVPGAISCYGCAYHRRAA